VQIAPDERNGFDRINWAIAHNVTTASKARIVKETDYFISPEHLDEIRASGRAPSKCWVDKSLIRGKQGVDAKRLRHFS
jgi:hypothetical protein